MSQTLAEGIKARLREIDRERDHLVALLALYEDGEAVPRVKATPSNGTAAVGQNGHGSHTTAFQPVVGGPTERILAVVRTTPGLSYSEIVERATKGINSNAENPARSAGSTLQSLVKRERIARIGGKHYLPESI
jgi:hypothetical protein